MELWSSWIAMLESALQLLAGDIGLGAGSAIVVLTLLLRFALLPVSWGCAWSACVHQHRLRTLQPQLEAVRSRCGDDPSRLAQETLAVYRRNDVAMLNARPLLGALLQTPVLLGMFQMLRSAQRQARFLWIENLARPDFWIAVIAAVTTALMLAANPDLPEQTRALMIWLPAIIAFVFAVKFASALGLYWAVSNCFAAAQTSAVHYLVAQRARSGRLRL